VCRARAPNGGDNLRGREVGGKPRAGAAQGDKGGEGGDGVGGLGAGLGHGQRERVRPRCDGPKPQHVAAVEDGAEGHQSVAPQAQQARR
jgi:hypothetical protein